MSGRCAIAILLCLPVLLRGQSFIYYPDDNAGGSYSAPSGWYPWFTNSSGIRHQILVPASALGGLPSGAPISSIGFFLGNVNGGPQAATYAVLQVRLGPAAQLTLANAFASNLVPGTETLVVDQPNAVIPSQGAGGAWVDFAFPQPFLYPGGSVIVDTQTLIPVATIYVDGAISANVPRLYGPISFPFPSPALEQGAGHKVRFGVFVSPLWQTNQPAADLTINFTQGLPPLVTTLAVGQPGLLLATSTSIGLPFDIIFGTAVPVPAGGGGLVLPDGQILNMDLGDPSLVLLSQVIAPMPFPGSLAIPFIPPAPLAISAQSGHLDPASPIGFSLSAANRLVVP